MFEKNYYCLVSGLKEYSLDTETKGFDAPAIVAEIGETLSKRDRRYLELFYGYYDIVNILYLRTGGGRFMPLGNFSEEELREELVRPVRLPAYIVSVLNAYAARDKEGTDADFPEGLDAASSLERNLFAAYYRECGRSKCRFLREWSRFDAVLRNVSAAYTARRKGIPVSEVVVGSGAEVDALSRSSAADFGLKGEVEYIDQIMAAVADNGNLLDKEHRIDLIRWNMAEELAAFDYFNINGILSYLVKVNLVYRWASLDAVRGREMLDRLVESLSGREFIATAGEEMK